MYTERCLHTLLITIIIMQSIWYTVGAYADDCTVANSLINTKPPHIEKIILSKDQMYKAAEKRVCVKSYPWPKGVFLINRHDDEHDDKAITANEMEQLANSISYALDKSDYSKLDAKSNKSLKLHVDAGADHGQIKRYGAFMHLKKLYDEARYEDLLKAADSYIKQFDIEVRQTNWDNMEDLTYFTKESLANFIVLYKYKAKSNIFVGTMKDKRDDLLEYANIRNSLSAQINFNKDLDSTEDLLNNAGCTTE